MGPIPVDNRTGDRHFRAKLTSEQIAEVCDLYEHAKNAPGLPTSGRNSRGYAWVAGEMSKRLGGIHIGASTVRDWVMGRTRFYG